MMTTSRLKLAELTSSIGAGVLGVGIGILIASLARGMAAPAIVLGLGLHLWGMLDKHRAERGAPQPGWSVATYWLCWIALAGLIGFLVLRAFD